MRICIVQPGIDVVSETFIQAHQQHLPADDINIIHGTYQLFPRLNGQPVLKNGLTNRGVRKVKRLFNGQEWDWEVTTAYMTALRQSQPDVVLAEYGPSAVKILPACRELNIPLVVHFHGYDASKYEVIDEFRAGYRDVFHYASGIVAVSSLMKQTLLSMGAPVDKVHLNPYGVDCEKFQQAQPAENQPQFLAVGRLVDKKAPHLTLMAFARMHQQAPESRLIMIGEGPLRGACQSLAAALDVQDAVEFMGSQPHDVVSQQTQLARALVQHSIVAEDGDCEGTPNAILEAGAAGLPVVATAHAGICDVVVDGETGFLVEEKDYVGMSERMLQLATNPELAANMGKAARDRITTLFTMEQSIDRLWQILKTAAQRQPMEPLGLPEAVACS